jgi:hypothetical protein
MRRVLLRAAFAPIVRAMSSASHPTSRLISPAADLLLGLLLALLRPARS